MVCGVHVVAELRSSQLARLLQILHLELDGGQLAAVAHRQISCLSVGSWETARSAGTGLLDGEVDG